MDIDRFIAEHEPLWDRLEELIARSGPRGARLGPDQVAQLVDDYRTASTHLSIARGRLADPALVARLTRLVSHAQAVVYGTRPPSWRAVGRFVASTFPAALWHLRRYAIVSAAALLLPAVAVGAWIGSSAAARDVVAPAEVREVYVQEDFEDYYSSQPSAQFASLVTTNNIRVGLLAFAAGVLLAAPTVLLLAVNGANLGVAAGLFADVGQLDRFFGLVLPHGLLELTAVVVAGAAGLSLGWSIVAPGDLTRTDALADAGRRAVVVVMGLVVMFVVSGLIEGFVTGSTLPTWARVGLGAFVEVVVLAWAVVAGRRAASRGLTGAVGEHADLERRADAGRRLAGPGPAARGSVAPGTGLTASPRA